MARLLDRLSPYNANWISWLRLWDRSCTRIESNFTDIFAALASMPDIADVHIAADYTGAADPAQFPVTVAASRYTNETDNTADATWSFTVDSGDLTATIAEGVLSITDITATSRVTISSLYQGVTKSRSFTVYLDVAAPPSSGSGGGGGTTATDSTLGNITSATYAAVTDELAVTVGSGGQVQLSAPLTVSTAAASPAGTYEVFGVWAHWDGASYVNLGTGNASGTDCTVSSLGGGRYTVSAGRLSVSLTVSGLTPGNTEKYKLYAKNASGTRTMTISGTASAVGS